MVEIIVMTRGPYSTNNSPTPYFLLHVQKKNFRQYFLPNRSQVRIYL
jgi:hypothetical protein